jgi:hypothetical protein
MRATESQNERCGILAKLLLAVAIMGLGATTARAQTPSPAGGGDFASEMARLVERAAELVPLIRDQVESPLMAEFENLSMWIAAIVMMLSFARVLRENDGGSKDLYYWVGRLVFCMVLFGTGPNDSEHDGEDGPGCRLGHADQVGLQHPRREIRGEL